MAFDPRIILGAGVGVQQIDTPLEMEAKRMALASVRQKALDDAQARKADETFRAALQANGGDYDAAIRQSEQQGYNMLPIREAIQKQQNTLLDGMKKRLDIEKTKSDVMGRIIPNIHSQEDWNEWLPTVSRLDPEFVQHIGPAYGPQFDTFRNMGVDADKQLEASQKAIEALSKGDYLKAAATMRFTSHSPEDWDGAKTLLGQYKIPPQIISHVEQMTPEEIQQAVQGVPKPEKDTAAKVGTFEDYVVRTYGENPTPAQILQARKAYGQADDRPRVSVSVSGPGTVGGLTAGEGGGLELAGTMTRLLGRIPVGMARGGNTSVIMNEAARQNKLIGQTPVAMMQKAAVYSSDKKALDQMTKMQSAAYAYENKAEAQLDIVDGLSDKVWRTKSPLINRAIIAGKTEVMGDPDATLLLNAIMTASTEYAKIMMGGTASAQAITDSAQKEAQKLLNAGMNQGTLKKATALMRTEMGLTNKGYDAAIEHINAGLGGQQAAPSTDRTVTQAELSAIAKKRGTTVDQERARATAAGYVVR